MTIVQHTATLDYYDGPILFEARDPEGGRYLAVAADTCDRGAVYAVVGVSPRRLRDFRCGGVDLRDLMIEAGSQEWYVTRASHATDEFALQRQVTPLADSPYLAEVGYRLKSAESSSIAVLDAAQRRDRLVIELKIDPPEGNLGRIRDLMQELVIQAVKVARETGTSRGATPAEDAARLELVDATTPGILLLENCGSEVGVDPVGLPTGLTWIDGLFERGIQDFERTFLASQLRQLVCPSFRGLLDVLAHGQLDFQYTWAKPTWALAKQHSIRASQAGRLSKVIELAIERWA